MCKDDIQSSLEKYMSIKSPDPSLFCLSNEDILKILLLSPIKHLKSDEKIRKEIYH